MNILIVDDSWPTEYSGKAIRILNTFKKLNLKHRLHFLYLGNSSVQNVKLIKHTFKSINSIAVNNSKANFFGKLLNLLLLKPGSCAKWKYRRSYQNVIREISKVIEENNVKAVHVYSFFTAQYFEDFSNVIKIWDIGDSYCLNYKRNLKFNNFPVFFNSLIYTFRLYNYEQEMIRAFDKTIFVSSKDASVHNNLKKRISVITNGVDLEYFKPIPIQEEPDSLIFTGHMSFEPNISAASWFIKHCLPIVKKANPNIKLYIVGAEPTEEVVRLGKNNGIIVTGKVDDVRPFLAKASIFIAPMVTGSGVKNKVLQAMAMEKPVISTTLGVEALSVDNNRHFLLSDNCEDFANKILELLDNKALRVKLGTMARKLVEEKYRWDFVINNYEALYTDS